MREREREREREASTGLRKRQLTIDHHTEDNILAVSIVESRTSVRPVVAEPRASDHHAVLIHPDMIVCRIYNDYTTSRPSPHEPRMVDGIARYRNNRAFVLHRWENLIVGRGNAHRRVERSFDCLGHQATTACPSKAGVCTVVSVENAISDD